MALFAPDPQPPPPWRPLVTTAAAAGLLALLQSRIDRGPWDLILDAAKLPIGLILSGARPCWRVALPCFPYSTSVWLGQSALRVYRAGPTEFLIVQASVLLAGLVLTLIRTGRGWPGVFTAACLFLGATAIAPDPRHTVMLWKWAGEPLFCGLVARLVDAGAERRVGT